MYRWVRNRHMIGLRGRNFMDAPWAGGVVLLFCVIVAMLLANLPATKVTTTCSKPTFRSWCALRTA